MRSTGVEEHPNMVLRLHPPSLATLNANANA